MSKFLTSIEVDVGVAQDGACMLASDSVAPGGFCIVGYRSFYFEELCSGGN
jgi:hypothetical protein